MTRRGVSAMTRRAKPSRISTPPATAIHWAIIPRPVKARDPELAATTGSGAVVGSALLVCEDPAPVAAPTVVDDAGFAVVDDPGSVVVVLGFDSEPLPGGGSVVLVAATVVCVGDGVVVADGGSFGAVVGVGEQ